MTEVKVAKWKVQRTVYVEQQNRIKKFVEERAIDAPRQELELRLSYLEKQFLAFNAIQINIELAQEEELMEPHRAEFEENYFTLVPYLQVLIQQKSPKTELKADGGIRSSGVRLPKIEIKKFSGESTKWLNFFDSFKKLVHENPSLDNLSRFHYLNEALQNDAARTIDSLELTSDNYEEAIKLLTARYDNKKIICLEHIRQMFSFPPLEKASAEGLRHLIDSFNSHLRALTSLGRPTQAWDDIIVFLVHTKLDTDTRIKWDDESAPERLSTVEELFKFLNRRSQTLEGAAQSVLTTKATGKDKAQPKISSSKQAAFVSTSRHNYTCNFCSKSGHLIHKCRKFLHLSIEDRKRNTIRLGLCSNCLRKNHIVSSCSSPLNCMKCAQRHHSLLHVDSPDTKQSFPSSSTPSSQALFTQLPDSNDFPISTLPPKAQTPPLQEPLETKLPHVFSSSSKSSRSYVLLATAVVRILDANGIPIFCRALLDSASQLNFISEALAAQLRLSRQQSYTPISGIGESSVICKYTTIVSLQSRVTGYSANFEAHILPKITENQPYLEINTEGWQIPKNINLADPQFNKPQRIDLLIGAELYFSLLSIGQIKLAPNYPTLQNTLLGWVVAGKFSYNSGHNTFQRVCNITTKDSDYHLNQQLERFWELEDTEHSFPTRPRSTEEVACEEHFREHVQRDATGRFIVSLPFLTTPSLLGNSRQMATRRFLLLENRLTKKPDIKRLYLEFMEEYQRLGHMRPITEEEIAKHHYFLPHHCVLKPESSTTKLRVVFDASAKTDTQKSLNDILMVGPVVQNDLFTILIRFRTHTFAFSADINKMYRQIKVNEEDTHFQYILWRSDPKSTLQIFRLMTVTYGTASAPYLSTRCLSQLAEDEIANNPQASAVLQNDVYVDDVLTGANTLEEAQQLKLDLINILGTAGMKLRKWCSNNSQLIEDIPNNDRESLLRLDNDDFIKTLGMYWQPITDQFRFNVQLSDRSKRITKRTVISDLARIFDPLGLAGPTIILGKIFMQELWELKLDWDSALPQHLHSKWQGFRDDLLQLNDLRINRHLSLTSATEIQLYGFADSSERAYGACIYLRCISSTGNISVNLICAKSRVAPVKKTTLPRLELSAAVLLAQLMQRLKTLLDLDIAKIIYYTDSQIVLAWINAPSSSWNTFVANRVSTIQQLTIISDWKHIYSVNNPADIISRGLMPGELLRSRIWFHGPAFLSTLEQNWHCIGHLNTDHELLERKKERSSLQTTSTPTNNFLDDVKYRNSFTKLRNVMAYVQRFISNTRLKENKSERQSGFLTTTELNLGLQIIIRHVQGLEFSDELRMLLAKQPISSKSSLKSLNPFLDDSNIIRVGGRLNKSELPFSSKYPILLPSAHPFTLTLITHFHIKHLHAGPQALLAAVRQEYWPLSGRRLTRKVVHDCLRCFKVRPSNISQLMASLPSDRTRISPPFHNVGVDYCGPFHVHYKIRGKTPTKAYLAVFVCFSTKAIHLELVTELTTAAFIGALKRFVATRGLCANIYSDNATNFCGANSELRQLYELFNSSHHEDSIIKMCQADGISWHFAPPGSPHFGGLYEAAVKSAKFHLKRIMSGASLTFEELNTLIKQVEATLNSRPLTPQSSDPSDFNALTPGHFLIGRPLTSIIEPIEEEKISTLKRWRLVQQLHQHFWTRWSTEYLTELQHRRTWTKPSSNLKLGDLVLVKDDNLPPLKWRMGRVTELHPGSDGLIRVVTLKTAQGVLKRAIAKVCPLPMQPTSEDNSASTTKDAILPL